MNITIYTIPDCQFCKQEKDFLTARGLQFEEKDVQQNREFLSEMLDISNKFAGVPFTVITKDDGQKVMLKGFTQSEFEQALGGGDATAAATAPAAPAPAAPADQAVPADSGAAAPAAPADPAMAAPTAPAAPTDDQTMATAQPADTSAMPDAPTADAGSTMPGLDEKPAAPADQAAPVASVDMAPPAETMPAAPATPAAAAPASAATEPQEELSGVLADLQQKSDDAPAADPAIPDFPNQ